MPTVQAIDSAQRRLLVARSTVAQAEDSWETARQAAAAAGVQVASWPALMDGSRDAMQRIVKTSGHSPSDADVRNAGEWIVQLEQSWQRIAPFMEAEAKSSAAAAQADMTVRVSRFTSIEDPVEVGLETFRDEVGRGLSGPAATILLGVVVVLVVAAFLSRN